MLVTPPGIVIDVSPEQPENACLPMLVTGYPSNDAGMTRLPEAGFAPDTFAVPSETEYDHSMPSMISVLARHSRPMLVTTTRMKLFGIFMA